MTTAVLYYQLYRCIFGYIDVLWDVSMYYGMYRLQKQLENLSGLAQVIILQKLKHWNTKQACQDLHTLETVWKNLFWGRKMLDRGLKWRERDAFTNVTDLMWMHSKK